MAYKRIKRIVVQHLGKNRHQRRKEAAQDRQVLRRLRRAMKRDKTRGA